MAENLLDEMSFEFIASSKGFVTMITSEPLFRMECTDMFPYQGVFREFLQNIQFVLIFKICLGIVLCTLRQWGQV